MLFTTMATALKSSTPRLLRHARRGMRTLTTTISSTTTTTPAEAAAQHITHTFRDRTTTHHQTLDAPQLQKLSLTLNRPHLHPGLDVTAGPPPDGTPLPPGYHLVYFTPAALEHELGPDGADGAAFLAAPPPFTRRMWAGGRMRWVAPPLRAGDAVEERTRLVGATAKRSRRGGGGGEFVLVEVEKEFWGPGGLALVDRRSWVFRPPPAAGKTAEEPVGAPVLSGAAAGWEKSSVEDVRAVDGRGESDGMT